MLNTVEMADDYFSTNFMNRDVWNKISAEDKAILIETAENDINAALRTSNIDSKVISQSKPYTAYQAAVFEWAVYMYTNKAKLNQITNNRIFGATSVTVDGIGRETYVSGTGNGGNNGGAIISVIKNSPAGKYLGMICQDVRIIR